MAAIVLFYCINQTISDELSLLIQFLSGNRFALRNFLSKSDLVIEAWERDPWVDYGRSIL